MTTLRVDVETMARLQRIAQADQRTVSAVMRLCLDHYLPELERKVLGAAANEPAPASLAHEVEVEASTAEVVS